MGKFPHYLLYNVKKLHPISDCEGYVTEFHEIESLVTKIADSD